MELISHFVLLHLVASTQQKSLSGLHYLNFALTSPFIWQHFITQILLPSVCPDGKGTKMARGLTQPKIDALKPSEKLTQDEKRTFKPDAEGRYYVNDGDVPGLAIRIGPTGRKSWVLKARFPGSTNPTRRTLALVGAIGIADGEIAGSTQPFIGCHVA